MALPQEAYVDSAALAESKLELQEERAAQGLSNEPTPAFEVEEVDDWEVREKFISSFMHQHIRAYSSSVRASLILCTVSSLSVCLSV